MTDGELIPVGTIRKEWQNSQRRRSERSMAGYARQLVVDAARRPRSLDLDL